MSQTEEEGSLTAAIAGAADHGEFKGTGGRRWDVSGGMVSVAARSGVGVG